MLTTDTKEEICPKQQNKKHAITNAIVWATLILVATLLLTHFDKDDTAIWIAINFLILGWYMTHAKIQEKNSRSK